MGLRVKGLIKLYNQVRSVLPVADQETVFLIEMQVKQAIKDIEFALERHQSVASTLPEPSRQAYHYLKTLDFSLYLKENEKKQEQNGHRSPPSKIRIKNLLKNYQYVIDQIAHSQKTFASLKQELEVMVSSIWELCEQSKSSPLDLPTPSLKAFSSLYFLSLNSHLEEAFSLREAIIKESQRWKHPVTCVFFTNGRYLWQYTPQKSHLLFNEGFLGLEQEQLEWLSAGFYLNDVDALNRLKVFAESESFYEPLLELEIACGNTTNPLGMVYNLDHIFEKMNQKYFQGTLAKPRLRFNKTLNTRKLGQYSATHDTILISSILDQPQVPEFAISLVMYHEMLHKFLGIEYRGGRRIMHSPHFRQLERRYECYEDAESWLTNWIFAR